MKIVTHPDNLELIKRMCDHEEFGDHGILGIEIVSDRHIERDRPSGRYIMPDGRTVPLKDVRVPDGRFFEWGPEDVRLLLWWGIIREEREPLFYQIDDSFMTRFWESMLAVPVPKYLVTTVL